jgi:LacI family sucrose operon transcriptional repressor
MPVTIQNVAKAAGVSKTTVSLVLNGKALQHRIGPGTVRKVRAAARKLGYAPSRFARGFRLQKSGTVGLIVGDTANYFFSLLEKSVETEARRHGYNILIACSNDNPRTETEALKDLLDRQVDAVIIASVHRDNREHRRLNVKKIPVVYVDRKIAGKNTVSVTSKNFEGAFKLVSRLIKTGHRRIAFIGGPKRVSTSVERYKGYRSALKKHGITARPRIIHSRDFTTASGYASGRRIPAACDAVFAASYTLLEGLLRYFKKHAASIPYKIKIAAFDDHPLLDLLPFGINSMRQNTEKIGRTAFRSALKAVNGKKGIKSRRIMPKTIIRRQ